MTVALWTLAVSPTKTIRGIANLREELDNLIKVLGRLDFSAGLVSPAVKLRDQLGQLSQLFAVNAACHFFPNQDVRDIVENELGSQWHLTPRKKSTRFRTLEPDLSLDLDAEALPSSLASLANELKTLLESLGQTPGSSVESLSKAGNMFQTDLKYWSSCLQEFQSMAYV